jgi:subfamily B ATP-binding cassette protein HlyB/CyaB
VIASAIAAPLMQRRYDAQFLAAARNQAFVTEHLAAIETVKSLQLETSLRSRYDDLLATYLDAGFRTRQLGNTYQCVAGALEQLLSTAILCVGAWIVMTSTDFTIGMLVAFQMFAARVAQPLLRLTGLWQQFQQAAIAVRRLADMMDVPAEPHALTVGHARRGPGRIEFVGVGFRYTSEDPWLHRQLALTIEPGQCVVLTGRSGRGKSTLLKLLLGFIHPTEGAVRIDGRDTRTCSANELRSRFGVVPQETTLFAGTLLENLQLGNPDAGFEQIVQACRMARIHDTLEALPKGYRSEVGERGVGLSGGQKQRIALARALLRRPQVLLLDEPFSQLDEESAASVASALSLLKGAVTIVIVSHHVPATLAADRRIELPN